ncbi:glycoside hydrolase family 13 protein [Ochrovirga pacifica]|uniref:glycoside hydrolase family 13 protein n=1 Tax=Ochrovirga pacifica TaxID=1042376 RepID=UPI000255A2EA|nr:glycoside hydrolase family 13 protein [Ochrovirga pacifica]
MKKLTLFVAVILMVVSCQQSTSNSSKKATKETAFNEPPKWAKEVVWYEIAVERFRNGDPSNDPTPEDIQGAYPGFVPKGWKITPWTQDWYKEDGYFKNTDNHKDFFGNTLNKFVEKVQLRRYGGDLQGVLDKIDYLDSLGVTAVYFRPLNDAPSLHKYDARNWRHIDRNFGPNPKKDAEIINSEIPEDPTTWKFTEADKMFLKVIQEFHQKGIKVILDYSWNHTGHTFWAWQDVLKNQEKSKYKDWYWIEEFDDPETEKNEFRYHGWAGVFSLPEIKETQKQDLSTKVRSFEGNVYSSQAKQHIFNITKRWLDPNNDGDPSDGVDGYRLDVAGEMPLDFWRDFRKTVRTVNPNAYLLGEIWWEEFPDKLLNPAPFLQGDVFDGVMNYRWYRASRHYFAAAPNKISTTEFIDSLTSFDKGLRKNTRYAMMNYTCGFDTPRLLTSMYNKNKYKLGGKVHENPIYKINKPNAATYQEVKLLLAQQYTYFGAPHIYAGDEMGMWGADDPSCRKPLIWSDYIFEDEVAHPLEAERPVDKVAFNHQLYNYYQKLIRIRKEYPVLIHGDITFLKGDDEVLIYKRFDESNEVFAVFNTSEHAKTITLDLSRKKYIDVLGGATIQQKEITIPAKSSSLLVAGY